MAFLDEVGLDTFWNICKGWFGSKVASSKSGNDVTVSLYGKVSGEEPGSNEDVLLTSTTLSLEKAAIPTASQGTAIPADDITSWSSGSLPSLTVTSKEISQVTGFNGGTRPSLTITETPVLSKYELTPTQGTSGSMQVEGGVLSVSFDTVVTSVTGSETTTTVGSGSAWDAGAAPSISFGDPVSVGSASAWNAGTLPSLTYDAKAIPNVSVNSGTDVVTDISISNN